MLAVVKVGTSSITAPSGTIDDAALRKLCGELAAARAAGHEVLLVSSGAIAAGLPALGLTQRPSDVETLQALAAVGQPMLMERFRAILAEADVLAGQVLVTPFDFGHRAQYLHARDTLRRLLELRVLPIINENDTVADDEIRFGDNDLIAALVANMVHADLLVLLTDTAGLFTADPRLDAEASLIEEVAAVDDALEKLAGGTGTVRGSGGMASKLAAAKIASWSGVRAVIAAADQPGVLTDALAGVSVGTVVQPHAERLPSRKLWIAFAVAVGGRVIVDDGAKRALVSQGRSLLAAGVRGVEGEFDPDEAVEVVGDDGRAFAKGLVRYSAKELRAAMGRRSSDLPDGAPAEVIHRDDLVVLVD